MSTAPDNAAILHSGRNYCWAATLSEDQRLMHVDLWVFDAPSARGRWTTVVGAGFSIDRDGAHAFLPLLQRFVTAPDRRTS